MKLRKITRWVVFAFPIAAVSVAACFFAPVFTPIEIELPDGVIITAGNRLANPKAVLAANGVTVSGMDSHITWEDSDRYILRQPKHVRFRGPDGFVRHTFTYADTVGEFLHLADLSLGEMDIVEPGPAEEIPESGEIRLIRVDVDRITREEEIPYKLVLEPDRTIPYGQEEIVAEGVNGRMAVTYRITSENSTVVASNVIREEIVKPVVNQRARVGIGWKRNEDQPLIAHDVIWMEATAYDPGPESNGKWTGMPTAYGMQVGYGVVAVDPKVIPLGTPLYIDGYGYAIAGDTGGAIKNLRIDLGYNTRAEALRFGRREVKVYVLDGNSKSN